MCVVFNMAEVDKVKLKLTEDYDHKNGTGYASCQIVHEPKVIADLCNVLVISH